MYENGRQVNRYENKCKHKKQMKREYAANWDAYSRSIFSYDWIERVCESWERETLKYWKIDHFCGSKKDARQQTSRKVRRSYKNMLNNDEAYVLKKGAYRKTYDYGRFVWDD